MVIEINSDKMHDKISSDNLLENDNLILCLVLVLVVSRHFAMVAQTRNLVMVAVGGVICILLLKCTELWAALSA